MTKCTPYSGDSGKEAQSSTCNIQTKLYLKCLNTLWVKGRKNPRPRASGPSNSKNAFCFICLLIPGADHNFSTKHPSVQTLPENQSQALQLSHILPITVATALRAVAHPKDRFSFYKIKAISVPNLWPIF